MIVFLTKIWGNLHFSESWEHAWKLLGIFSAIVRAPNVHSGFNWKLSFSPQNYAPDIGAVKRKPAITGLMIKIREPATLLPAKHSLWLRTASWISAMWLQRKKLVPLAAQQQALTIWTQEGDSTSVPSHWHPCCPRGSPKQGSDTENKAEIVVLISHRCER